MTGLLTKVDRPLLRARGRFDPDLRLDLPFVPRASVQPLRGTATAYSRSSVAHCFDAVGILRALAADEPCFDHDLADSFAPLGLRLEDQAINEIRNNTMAGANAATDALPTDWAAPGNGWDTAMDVTGVGSEDGLDFIELRFNGNPTGFGVLWFDDNGVIAAAQGETWTLSSYVRLVAGDFTNVPNVTLRVRERDASSTLADNDSADIKDSIAAPLGRVAFTTTLGQAATTNIRAGIKFASPGGSAVDFTLRLYLPQCEEQPFATSPIKTSGVAATRNAAVLTSTVTDFPDAGALVCLAHAPDGQNPADGTLFHAADVAADNALRIARRANDDPRVTYRTAGGATSTVDVATAWADAAALRIAVGWDQDRVQMSVDQATPAEVLHTGVAFAAAPSGLSFGHAQSLTNHLGGHITLFRLYSVAKFGADLQAL